MFAILFDITMGSALALLLRRPARRLFGAGPAFTLWVLPPLFAVRPLLPVALPSWSLAPARQVAPATQALMHHAASPTPGLGWLWLA